MPFLARAIQVDDGSEFEAECQRHEIKVLVLLPRSAELNSHAEQAHRTPIEEFHEVMESSFNIADLRGKLMQWEQTYNTIRPH